ncbi:VirD4-like conjugal transfer protein, CD1115 family [Domibacillus iocasae]|uniref:Conjugal transfer protein TraG n=1 Tax=Domibacillus iocasae TaxID=1714016 RepID=A0A1E7DQN2_9BACI|nr:type IV secretory system conjugative DNA transfer family protein [Domibacillus iocasae]OES45381.1 hypothetical protein BA724_05095 [Domibacillus iocasae]
MTDVKESLKRSLLITAIAVVAAEYISAAALNDFSLFKNYQFNLFYEAFQTNFFHPVQTLSEAFSNDLFIQIQPFLVIGTLFLFGRTFFQKKNQYEEASQYGAYGTSRWAKDSEIFKTNSITTKFHGDGTILGIYKRKPIIQHDQSHLNRNVLLVGGSGAGKTRSVIIPNILNNTSKSIIAVDPKAELYEKTSQAKREQGYEVRLINFKNRDVSDRYNLFEYIRKDSDAFKIADTLVNNAGEGSRLKKDFWNQAQTSVLQALILYVKYALPSQQQHMGSVMAVGQLPEEKLKEAFHAFDSNHVVRKAYQTAVDKLKEKTMGDVFVTLMQTLNPWQYEDVCQFTAANDFLFEDLGKKKMIVYIIMPIADNEFRPLITSFFTQMFSELYRLADQHYGRLPNSVLLQLDEFANIGKVPNFEERLSTTRSLGIEVTIVLQDTSQLERVYGKEIAKEVMNNCDIRLLLKAGEHETAKYFSQLAGKTTIRVKNQSNSSSRTSSSKSESAQYMGRDLITADEITRLNKDEALLFLSGQYPMRIEKAWFDRFKHFKGMLSQEVSREDYPVADRSDYSVFCLNDESSTADSPYIIDDLNLEETEQDHLEEELEIEQRDSNTKQTKNQGELEDLMDEFKF